MLALPSNTWRLERTNRESGEYKARLKAHWKLRSCEYCCMFTSCSTPSLVYATKSCQSSPDWWYTSIRYCDSGRFKLAMSLVINAQMSLYAASSSKCCISAS